MAPQADRQRLGTDLLTIATDIHGTDSLIVRRIRERLFSLARCSLTSATGARR